VFAPGPDLTVEVDQCFRLGGHADLQGEDHARVPVPGADLIDLEDIEHGRVDGERVLRGDHVLVYPRCEREPLQQITVQNYFTCKLGVVQMLKQCRNMPVQFLPEPLIQCKVVLESLLSPSPEFQHPVFAGRCDTRET
jgi:hypothetical protein